LLAPAELAGAGRERFVAFPGLSPRRMRLEAPLIAPDLHRELRATRRLVIPVSLEVFGADLRGRNEPVVLLLDDNDPVVFDS